MKGLKMNKILNGLVIAASLIPAFAQEAKQEEKTYQERYNEAIEKQMAERKEAFKPGKTLDEKELNNLIERQRNVILALEKERQNQRQK